MNRKIELTEVPVACTLDRSAFEGRMREFDTLFQDALIDSERTPAGIRFRFADRQNIEARIRDLAARELECCSFFSFTISTHDTEVWWDASVGDDAALPVLDDFLALPERLAEVRP